MEKAKVNVLLVWFLAGYACCVIGTAPLRLLHKTAHPPSSVQGILQIYHNGQWGTICDDDWDMLDTKVACKQLGYESAVASKFLGQGPDPIWLENLGCIGNELSLDQCTHSGWGSHNCGHDEDVGIVCTANRYEQQVEDLNSNKRMRTAIITYPSTAHCDAKIISMQFHIILVQGILQIYHNGQWGTICDDSWRMPETKIACKQLGYDAVSFKHLGRGPDPIWLDEVDCNGNESLLEQCHHRGSLEKIALLEGCKYNGKSM
ncbi:Neurotrypsin [Exaiptasia diaphana]|nr:Neurotrypsin [Exaiptasia diaphana]